MHTPHKFAPGGEISISGQWKICKKKSILQCKIDFFCIFGGSRKCISHKFAPGVEISISGKWKKCKNSVLQCKMFFFAYLVAPENA